MLKMYSHLSEYIIEGLAVTTVFVLLFLVAFIIHAVSLFSFVAAKITLSAHPQISNNAGKVFS